MHQLQFYSFLASAVAGRRIFVQLSSGELDVAYSDGQVIMVPHRENKFQTWLEITAQAALIAAASLDPPVLRHLAGRPRRANRYLYLEVLRATHLIQDRLPLLFTEHPELRGVKLISSSVQMSLAIALSGTNLPETPKFFGAIRPFAALRQAVREAEFFKSKTKKKQNKILTPDSKLPPEDNESESSAVMRLLENPISASSRLAKWLDEIMGAAASQNGRQNLFGENAGVEISTGRIEQTFHRGIDAILNRLPFEFRNAIFAGPSRGESYPEWDTHTQSYRHDWVLIKDVAPPRRDAPTSGITTLPAPKIRLRRQLAKLGLNHETHRRQKEGADLDGDAVVDFAIELKAGHSPAHDAIYRDTRRSRRDLGVAILLDISGSTDEQRGASTSVFEKQRLLAYQLALAFTELGDTVAMFGFHSLGHKRVHAVQLKDYKERGIGMIANRLMRIEPSSYTRIGAAIRHGTKLLSNKMRLPNRLMVLVTDGIPYDLDYEEKYAADDTSKALQEAKSSGIACICLCVGASTETRSLAEIFGTANIIAVEEPDDIVVQIRQICSRALSAVSIRRRDRIPLAE